jgi:hypothetical protein
MFTNEELHKRIRLLEENIAWMQRDMVNLTQIIEHINSEIHYHFYQDFRTCKDDQRNSDDINDFI